jgi:hypothetical protein
LSGKLKQKLTLARKDMGKTKEEIENEVTAVDDSLNKEINENEESNPVPNSRFIEGEVYLMEDENGRRFEVSIINVLSNGEDFNVELKELDNDEKEEPKPKVLIYNLLIDKPKTDLQDRVKGAVKVTINLNSFKTGSGSSTVNQLELESILYNLPKEGRNSITGKDFPKKGFIKSSFITQTSFLPKREDIDKLVEDFIKQIINEVLGENGNGIYGLQFTPIESTDFIKRLNYKFINPFDPTPLEIYEKERDRIIDEFEEEKQKMLEDFEKFRNSPI